MNESWQKQPAASGGPAQRPTGSPDNDLAWRTPGQGLRAKVDEVRALQSRSPSQTLGPVTDDEAWSWNRGAEWEAYVGAMLESLRCSGWRLLHDVPVRASGTDIDHVLIGPGGIFTINTKAHSNARITIYERTIYVNGKRKNYLSAARGEAAHAAAILRFATGMDLWVNAALVFVGGPHAQVARKGDPRQVLTLTEFDVPSAFTSMPPRLHDTQVDAVFQKARWRSVWFPSATPVGLPPPT